MQNRRNTPQKTPPTRIIKDSRNVRLINENILTKSTKMEGNKRQATKQMPKRPGIHAV